MRDTPSQLNRNSKISASHHHHQNVSFKTRLYENRYAALFNCIFHCHVSLNMSSSLNKNDFIKKVKKICPAHHFLSHFNSVLFGNMFKRDE